MFELITPPAAEPFVLDDVRQALRLDHDTDDTLVMRLGQTARRLIERRLGLAVADQVWRLTHEGRADDPLTLRPGPVREITSVELRYGDAPHVASDEWRFIRSRPSKVEITAPRTSGGAWLEEVRITFASGRTDLSGVPADLVQAIMMLTAHYYENREAVAEGRYVAVPAGVETILQSLREAQL